MIPLSLAIAIVIFSIGGCSSTKKVERSETASAADEWAEYEAGFHPSEYDPHLGVIFSEVRKTQPDGPRDERSTPVAEPPVLVPGFRVQLYATTNIDEVNAQKLSAESAFPDVQLYIVFDPPTYKLRAGNFLSRAEAESFASRVQAKGYPDAWVVPDRVPKDPTQR